MNGDGKLDLIVAADVIGVYPGNGNGTFAKPPTYYQPMASGISPGIAIADFNSDAKLDVAVDGEILLGTGNGRFQGPPTVLLPGSPAQVIGVAGKFVTNGAPGIAAIAANPGTSLYILTNDGTGVLSLAHTYTLPQPGFAKLPSASFASTGS